MQVPPVGPSGHLWGATMQPIITSQQGAQRMNEYMMHRGLSSPYWYTRAECALYHLQRVVPFASGPPISASNDSLPAAAHPAADAAQTIPQVQNFTSVKEAHRAAKASLGDRTRHHISFLAWHTRRRDFTERNLLLGGLSEPTPPTPDAPPGSLSTACGGPLLIPPPILEVPLPTAAYEVLTAESAAEMRIGDTELKGALDVWAQQQPSGPSRMPLVWCDDARQWSVAPFSDARLAAVPNAPFPSISKWRALMTNPSDAFTAPLLLITARGPATAAVQLFPLDELTHVAPVCETAPQKTPPVCYHLSALGCDAAPCSSATGGHLSSTNEIASKLSYTTWWLPEAVRVLLTTAYPTSHAASYETLTNTTTPQAFLETLCSTILQTLPPPSAPERRAAEADRFYSVFAPSAHSALVGQQRNFGYLSCHWYDVPSFTAFLCATARRLFTCASPELLRPDSNWTAALRGAPSQHPPTTAYGMVELVVRAALLLLPASVANAAVTLGEASLAPVYSHVCRLFDHWAGHHGPHARTTVNAARVMLPRGTDCFERSTEGGAPVASKDEIVPLSAIPEHIREKIRILKRPTNKVYGAVETQNASSEAGRCIWVLGLTDRTGAFGRWVMKRRLPTAATDDAVFVSTAWLRNAATLRDEADVLDSALLLNDAFAATMQAVSAARQQRAASNDALHRDVCRAALAAVPPRDHVTVFGPVRRAVEVWLAPLHGLPRVATVPSRRHFVKRQLQISTAYDEHLFWNHDQLLLAACRAQIVLRG